MNITHQQLLYSTGFILAGVLLGWLFFSGPGGGDAHPDHDQLSPEEMDQHVQETHTDEEGNIIYTCSMHPHVRENEPGNCPICGMELIPVSASQAEVNENDYSMVMTAAATKLAQIQTSPVTRAIPEKELRLPGRIRVDERRLTNVTAYFPGRIQDIKVNFTGAQIRKGEPMATIYSPELISAQRELLEAARQQDRNPRLYESTRQKFSLWGFTDEQINEIANSGEVQRELEIHSPVDGYVLSRNIANQQYVTEGTVMYEVADLSRVWVVLEAYEEDVEWIETGDTITFRTRNNPGERYEATVAYIDPVVDPVKRTVGIRADMNNPGHDLKPDMLVSGILEARMDSEKLLVPASSVLWTGPRSLVYVQDISADAPRFEVREVELGTRAGDYYVIEDGVEEGEEVVFHGAFRIDSEMQLADRFSMMNRTPGEGRGMPAMPGMDMNMDHDEMDMEEETDSHNREEMQEESFGKVEDHSDHVPDDFREEFTGLIETYLDLKEALIESDFEQAGKTAKQTKVHLQSMGEHRLEGDAHVIWMETYQNLTVRLNAMTDANSLEEIREDFSSLSGLLIEAVQTFGMDGIVYHQYCPMEDASWLSSAEQIHNPYMPDTMPDCGEVIEKIENK